MFVAVIVGTLVLAGCLARTGTFILINRASEPIAGGSVSIGAQVMQFSSIQPGHSVTHSYRVEGGSNYEIKIDFQSGKHLSKALGYLTSGVEFKHEISVTDSDIEITATHVR